MRPRKACLVIAVLFSAFLASWAFALNGAMWIPASGGLAGLAVGPNSRVAELVYVDANNSVTNPLRYRERVPGRNPGEWQTVTGGATSADALLWFGADNDPRVVYDATTQVGFGNSAIISPLFIEVKRTGNSWAPTGRSWRPARRYRSVLVKRGEQIGVIMVGANRIGYSIFGPDGSVSPEEIIDQGFVSETLLRGFDAIETIGLVPRNVSAAFDNAGRLHVVYSKNQQSTPIQGGTIQRSSLFYSRRGAGGTWTAPQELNSPGAGFGDGGIGASIACAPDGTVAIAAAYLPRVATGSTARFTELRYMVLNANGSSWSTSVVANRSDNYISGDGEMGAGLEPFLSFDSLSRPFIVFTDHASAHIPFCISWSGQVRLAARSSSTSGPWSLSKLVSRDGKVPSDFTTWRPSLVVAGDHLFASALSFAWMSGDWSPQYNSVERTVSQFLGGKLPQTITFAQPAAQIFAPNRIFTLAGSADSGLGVSFSSSNPNVLSVSGNIATIRAAGSAVITANQGGNATYNPAPAVARAVTIGKGSQGIRPFVVTNNVPFGTVLTLTNTNSTAGLAVAFERVSGPVSVNGNRATITGTGPVALRAIQNGNANYNAAVPVTNRFTAVRAAQSIRPFAVTNNVPFGTVLTLTNTNSTAGLAVAFERVSGPVSVNGNRATITGTGPVALRAIQNGSTSYNAAVPVTNRFTAVKAAQTITFTNLPATAVFRSNGMIPLGARSSSGLPVTYTSAQPGVLQVVGASAVFKNRGTVVVTASQRGDANHHAANNVSRTITIR